MGWMGFDFTGQEMVHSSMYFAKYRDKIYMLQDAFKSGSNGDLCGTNRLELPIAELAR